MNVTASAEEIAADLLDRLKRHQFGSANDFIAAMNAQVHSSRRTQIIDKLFELGLVHLTDPVSVQLTYTLLDWEP